MNATGYNLLQQFSRQKHRERSPVDVLSRRHFKRPSRASVGAGYRGVDAKDNEKFIIFRYLVSGNN
jgi:hypothetical protein